VQIQVNSDGNIAVDTQVIRSIGAEVNRVLKRFADRLTRVQVHLRDVNSHKFGTHDKRCLIEARLSDHRALNASSGAATVKEAVGGALTKLQNSLQTFFGRLGKRHQDTTVTAKSRRSHTGRRRSLSIGNASAASAVADDVGGAMPRNTKKSSLAARKSAPEEGFRYARGPKKKGIYQARRKSWPAR
jgi:hypothetical protein